MRKTGAGGATYVATEGEVAGVLKAARADRSDWPAVIARVYAVYEASATAWKCARDARTLGLNAHQGRLAGAAIALAVFASILIKFANAPTASRVGASGSGVGPALWHAPRHVDRVRLQVDRALQVARAVVVFALFRDPLPGLGDRVIGAEPQASASRRHVVRRGQRWADRAEPRGAMARAMPAAPRRARHGAAMPRRGCQRGEHEHAQHRS